MADWQAAPGVVGPFAGLDVPWLLRMRSESRSEHPFLIWAPFDAPARHWSYREFHERVGALGAGLRRRGIKAGDCVLIHLDNCIEAMRQTGEAMNERFKETSLGGLAVNLPEC